MHFYKVHSHYYVKADKTHLQWHIMSYISLKISANIQKGSYNKAIISAHQLRKKNQSNALRPSSIFQKVFRTKNGLLQKAAVHKPGIRDFQAKKYFKWFGAFFFFFVFHIMAKLAQKLYLREQLLWASYLIRLFELPVVRSFLFQNMVYIIVRAHRLVLSDRSRKCLVVKSSYVPLTFTHQ